MFLRTLIILLLLVSLKLTAQQENQEVEFNLSLLQGDSKVSLGELFSADGKKYNLSTFKFFISDPHFFKNGKELHPNSNEVQLVDFSEEKSPSWVWNYPIDQEADSVSFNIGLSKEINTSGVYGGALDPTTGMYWTWNTGYIHLKIEGSFVSDEPSEFSYHLGGYLEPNAAIQKVGFALSNHKVYLELQLLDVISKLPFDSKLHLMQTGEEASRLLKDIANCIHLGKL